MGVERTDYLMWGAKIDPDTVDVDRDEAELYGEEGRDFDMVYDGMCGEYAIAGKIIAKSEAHEGGNFQQITADMMGHDPEVSDAVRKRFPEAMCFGLFMFSHYH